MSTIAVEKCGRNASFATYSNKPCWIIVNACRPCDYVNLPQYAQTGPASVLRRLFTPSTTADPYKTTSIGRYLSVGENDSEDDDI
ncbi:hypothetical protein V9T40_010129 [Parthenolecanium corni]|uniref:Uncharacterized protein n=1 Tax=Parthenolecanium corni TaxID=536013 RepID=A0AAN9XX09_9HEMI